MLAVGRRLLFAGVRSDTLRHQNIGFSECAGEIPGRPAGEVTFGVVRTESSGGIPIDVPFWVGENTLRLDVSNPLDMSVVWRFGSSPEMLMIQRETGKYVAWGPEQLEGARRLMEGRFSAVEKALTLAAARRLFRPSLLPFSDRPGFRFRSTWPADLPRMTRMPQQSLRWICLQYGAGVPFNDHRTQEQRD